MGTLAQTLTLNMGQQVNTHRTDSASRGRGGRARGPDHLGLLALLARGAGGWADRVPGRRSSARDPGPRQAPAPPLGECCYSSSGCSWACSRQGSRQPPSERQTMRLETTQIHFHLTFVSCGLGGPCILQLYMFCPGPAPWPGYWAPAPAPPPGESLLAPATGSCQDPAPAPGSPVTPWPGA